MLSYRKAKEEDIPYLIELDSAAQSRTYVAFTTREEWLAEMSEANVYIYLESFHDRTDPYCAPVGMISLQNKSVGHVYLAGLVIDQKYRRKGYAAKIIRSVIWDHPLTNRIDLVTHPHNTAAIILYLKNGFVIESWKENFYGDGEPRIVMVRMKN